jgi:hypothetical protein
VQFGPYVVPVSLITPVTLFVTLSKDPTAVDIGSDTDTVADASVPFPTLAALSPRAGKYGFRKVAHGTSFHSVLGYVAPKHLSLFSLVFFGSGTREISARQSARLFGDATGTAGSLALGVSFCAKPTIGNSSPNKALDTTPIQEAFMAISHTIRSALVATLERVLAELGWHIGKNERIEYRACNVRFSGP